MYSPWRMLRIVPFFAFFGCASPGPPHPPSLHLPEIAKAVAAQRIGDGVRVSWTSPADTTDGDRIRGTSTAVLCREVPPGSRCAPVQRLAMIPGASLATDPLPADLRSGPARLLIYRVELLNAKGRSAGESDPGFAAAGEAPPAVGPLTLSARRNAVLVRWAPARSSAAGMELRRTLVASVKGPLPTSASTPAKHGGGNLLGPKPPPGETILHSPARNHSAAPDGLLDATVEDSASYTYVAQRVLEVTVSGHAVELRGLPSPPATFTFRDVFPPQAPTGLVAIPGEGFGAPLSIDLSWEPNVETDLLGYNVYRRSAGGEFLRMNAAPIPVPAYRDFKVGAGQTYAYRVTAIDRRDNESRPSIEVHERPKP